MAGVPCEEEADIDGYVREEMRVEAELGYADAEKALRAAEEALLDQIEAVARIVGNADGIQAAREIRGSVLISARRKLLDLAMRAPLPA